MKAKFGKIKKNPNGFGWITTDGAHWDYRSNAIGRQRWLNMQLWLNTAKIYEHPHRISSETANQLQRAMVVLR